MKYTLHVARLFTPFATLIHTNEASHGRACQDARACKTRPAREDARCVSWQTDRDATKSSGRGVPFPPRNETPRAPTNPQRGERIQHKCT